MKNAWFEIASFSDFKEILSLEATCKFLCEVVSNRLLWLKCLHALDQDHAPDLPRHVSISDLTWQELRTIVVRSQRCRFNCTGPNLLQAKRETTIHIGSVNSDGTLGGPLGYIRDMGLLPGGKLLLVLWSESYLQCWTEPSGECLWTYRPHASSEAQGIQPLNVCSFAYDMQADDDVRMLVVGEPVDRHAGRRTLEILQFSLREKNLVPLYKCKLEELDKTYGPVRFAEISGVVSAAYTEDHLVPTFWKEDRSVVLLHSVFKSVDLVDDYLIGVLDVRGSMSIIAILISSVCNIHCLFPPRPHLRWLKAGLSFCTFHWKSDAERKRSGTMITVLLDVLNEELHRNYSVLDYLCLETATDTTNTPESGVLLPNSDIPHLTHLRYPGSVALDPLPSISSYSQVSAPSQTGLMVIMPHCGARFRDPAKNVCMLAAISCANEVALCTFEMPRAVSVNVEFYSGALCFATVEPKSLSSSI